MVTRGYFGSKTAIRPGAGPLCRMVSRESEALSALYDRFRDAWDRRDLGNATIAFERFREALITHVQWEQDALFGEWRKRCRDFELDEVRVHGRQHELASALTARIEQLLRRRLGLGASVDDELVLAIYELENLLVSHQRAELHEVCCRLDALLSDAEIDAIADDLDAHGRIRP